MKTAALIVGAGRGERAGGGTPKQWRRLAGKRLIDHTISAFERAPSVHRVVLVLNAQDEEQITDFRNRGVLVATGGADRATSVANGLSALAETRDGTTHVLIHDAARPCVSQALIGRVTDGLTSHDGVAPALPVTDALWTGLNDRVTGTQDRTGLYAAQTPQGFALEKIIAAHENHSGGAADDVEVARAAGISVAIVEGDQNNLKVTLPDDFERAENILGTGMKIRLGNGFDVHRFGPGAHVTLCGVEIPYERALQGHSDADVGMHAVTDAIYGALARGDIGQHFPPSDPQWKGAASDIFLRHAVNMAHELGYRVGNIDCTLICEHPKIGPHAKRMRETMASIMQIDPDDVSIKATTSERLGFTGRGEGIAAMATATLVTS